MQKLKRKIKLPSGSAKELQKYLKYYLLTNTLSYLTIYAAQEEWHLQIHWLLKTWNEALNIILKNYSTEENWSF
jgi:hypothetical protein